MPQAIDSITSVLEQINEHLRDLESRVAVIESRTEQAQQPQSSGPQLVAGPPEPLRPPAIWQGFPPVEMPSGAVAIVGRSVLGIAGAYLLRAVAESGAVPKLLVLFAAILYACGWMLWAAHAHAANRFASAAYAVTSAMILSPLLWESTVRFHVVSPALASVVLVAFVALSLLLAWRRELQLIPSIATLSAVFVAVALMIETHDLVPLSTAVLAVAFATEAEACLGHHLALRAIPALAADFAVWLLVFILASSDGVPEEYHPVASATIVLLCFLLFAIYCGSIGIRGFALRHRVTFFEIVQGMLAFGLASFGVMRAKHNAIESALGILFLLFAAICYWGTLSRFSGEDQTRNRRVSATWAAALLLAGSFLVFPVNLQIPFLCLAAAASAWVYTRSRKLSLGIHASFYLAAAAVVSPLPTYVAGSLVGDVPTVPDWRMLVLTTMAVLCCALGWRVGEDQRARRLLWALAAAVVGFVGAALAVVGIAWLAVGHMELAASTLSVVRTIVNCVLALAFAFLGSRGKRIELTWLAYAAVAFGTLKLLFEDLRFGNAASLVVSLLSYGLILILLPRLTRSRNVRLTNGRTP